MLPCVGDDRHRELLRLHRDLDLRCRRESDAFFVSGWECANPFAADFARTAELSGSRIDYSHYYFLSDKAELISRIRHFHLIRDGQQHPVSGIFPAAGASILILSKFLFLLSRGVDTLYYIPPLYYSYYYYSSLFRIRLTRICERALIDSNQQLELPNCPGQFLVLTDPIWIMGRRVDPTFLHSICQWQGATNGNVFVDGTFQYLGWDGNCNEASSVLDPARTARLVCPTKALALHGERFAYLLFPPEWREEFRYACSNAGGAGSGSNLPAALAMMDILCSREHNTRLLNHIKGCYHRLVDSGQFTSRFGEPDCGYYLFGRYSDLKKRTLLTMDGRFFDMPGAEDAVRVNLLAPALL
jgi:aspartate/methionine/tyrosine aminotransferase